MTTQFGDKLNDGDATFHVKPFPLNQLGGSWSTEIVDGKEVRRFQISCTACWRGYVATWSIIDGKLVLTSIDACDMHGNQVSLKDIFGVAVLQAFWYSGELSSPLGNRIYGMYEPIYEQDNVWVFEHGVLIKRYVRTNQVPDESSSCARVETTNAATKPYELPVAELLDRLALSGELDQLTDEHMDRMEKTIMQGIDSILTVKSWFVPDYDSERDPEFDSLRDAWQQLTHQHDTNDSRADRIQRTRDRQNRRSESLPDFPIPNSVGTI